MGSWRARARLGLALGLAIFQGGAWAHGHEDDCPASQEHNFSAGYGVSFQFGEEVQGRVLPLTYTWACNRYELGAFFFGQQTQRGNDGRSILAHEDYAASLSRRWSLRHWHTGGVFFGLGGSYRTRAGPPEGNPWNGSHLNFAEQIGVRYRPDGSRLGFELSLRHFSNLGIVRPNVGQNFVVATLVF